MRQPPTIGMSGSRKGYAWGGIQRILSSNEKKLMQSQQETQAGRQESTCFDQTSKHCETYLEYDRLVWPWHCLFAILQMNALYVMRILMARFSIALRF